MQPATDETIPKRRLDSAWPRRPRSWWKWPLRILTGLAVLIGLFLAADWAWKNWLTAPADPNLTAPVNISAGAAIPEDNSVGGQPEPVPLPGILADLNQAAIDAAAHPLEPVMQVAFRARALIESDLQDYTAVLVNEVRLDDGKLRGEQYVLCKVRHEQTGAEGKTVPLSLYTCFLKPVSMQGQEAIWVKDRNDNRLVAHPAGLLNLTRVWLEPDGPIAMRGNRYPIWDLGIQNLLNKIIEKGERDLKEGDCEVRLDLHASINERRCVLIEVRHPVERPPFDFHIARIYVDVEEQLPVAYEGYLWPIEPGGEPPLLERYVYQQIVRNPGLTDADFDPDNPGYNYPGGD
jgi:Protein of unknown function (DUF1571)